MKLNGGPKQYMPLPQSQSDEDENSFLKQSKQLLETEKNGIANGCTKTVDNKETSNNEEKQSMSTLRKIFFVFSIFLCVFFIILFIWIIPCQLPILPITAVTKDWSLKLNDIDLVTTLLLANNHLLPHPILIMGFKNQQDNLTGLTAIDSVTGQQLWVKYLHNIPIYGKFGDIDANGDGIPDCLILGDGGLLFVINVTNGHELWYFHDHTKLETPPIILPPVLFPSCENKAISDLIGIISDEELQPYFVSINTSTGCQKNNPLLIAVCDGKMTALNVWESNNMTSLIFQCKDEIGNVNVWSLSRDIYCHLNQTDVNWRKLYSLKNAKNAIIKPIEKSIVIVDDGNVILLNEIDIKWKLSYNFTKIRAIFDGYFTSEKLEIALVIQDNDGNYMLNIINYENSTIVWSKDFSKSVIVSAKKVSNILPKSDGILLKLNSPSTLLTEKFANSTDLHFPNTTTDVFTNINILNESYALLMCWKSFTFTPLFQNTILTRCESQCWPNLHLSYNTGIMVPEKNGLIQILTVSSTLVPTNFSFAFRITLDSTTFQFQPCSMT
ncbi:uncharacterized protein LOC111616111 [Centruroides sculpturatus]|uniref:uncharacterized protein LOC111616111 n=1 Tax=Centruroides sculpturatus TaxID=218467 RepID=UPI000C6D072E|nr:uncharacterized protein LOC111616111 [Centruroides sculpturatus]